MSREQRETGRCAWRVSSCALRLRVPRARLRFYDTTVHSMSQLTRLPQQCTSKRGIHRREKGTTSPHGHPTRFLASSPRVRPALLFYHIDQLPLICRSIAISAAWQPLLLQLRL